MAETTNDDILIKYSTLSDISDKLRTIYSSSSLYKPQEMLIALDGVINELNQQKQLIEELETELSDKGITSPTDPVTVTFNGSVHTSASFSVRYVSNTGSLKYVTIPAGDSITINCRPNSLVILESYYNWNNSSNVTSFGSSNSTIRAYAVSDSSNGDVTITANYNPNAGQ